MFRPDGIDIKPSLWLLGAWLVAVLLCIFSLLLTRSHWLLWPLSIVVGGYLFYLLFSFVLLRKQDSVTRLEWQEEHWSLQLRNGLRADVELLPGTLVRASIILLDAKDLDGQQRYRILLLPDSAEPEKLRRLRVCAQAAV